MMDLTPIPYKRIIEGAIMASEQPLSLDQIIKLFDPETAPTAQQVKLYLQEITKDYQDRGIHLKELASGYRFQVNEELAPWIQKLWQERPAKYSRALLETLALVVYRQPITRAEIEEIRGVAVGSNIIKTLQEREWVKIVGHKELPGKPALYATTKQFLDDFNLKELAELPPLSELSDLEALETQMEVQLQLPVSAPKNSLSPDLSQHPESAEGNLQLASDSQETVETELDKYE